MLIVIEKITSQRVSREVSRLEEEGYVRQNKMNQFYDL